eukprot:TRINITY_DN5245_c0_g1_i1.p1 TRINITY_DN5245_c0_g1~~TRINITY_DN5245_c0_g1_i1.p1  ORF type:complete len:172 (+),score=14.94 TRINITY_DN5245_c0_g1_i1:209-724(+)
MSTISEFTRAHFETQLKAVSLLFYRYHNLDTYTTTYKGLLNAAAPIMHEFFEWMGYPVSMKLVEKVVADNELSKLKARDTQPEGTAGHTTIFQKGGTGSFRVEETAEDIAWMEQKMSGGVLPKDVYECFMGTGQSLSMDPSRPQDRCKFSYTEAEKSATKPFRCCLADCDW